MKEIIDSGFIEEIRDQYNRMQDEIAKLGADMGRNVTQMRNENSDLDSIAMIEQEAKDDDARGRLIRAYKAIAGSPDMLKKLDDICRDMNITDKTQRDTLKKALM